MNLLKFSLYTVGGAVGLSAAAAFGGIGVVAGGAAVGLSALEVAIIGGGVGSTVYKIRSDQAKAKHATTVATRKQSELTDKIAKAREVLAELESDESLTPTKPSRFVAVDSSKGYM